MSFKHKVSTWLFIIVLVIMAIVTTGWLLWRGMSKVPPDTARLWALVATVLIPISAWLAWYFGHIEVKGRLAGIDQAVDKVMLAAARTAGIPIYRRPYTSRNPYIVMPNVALPNTEIVQRQLPDRSDIVEL